MIKTGKDLAAACLNVAENYKTLYVMGCFGAPMTESNKARYINHHSYNQKTDRKQMINAASEDTFGFDCVCLIKALLWGWKGDKDHIYGGANYGSNGVPDIGTEQIIEVCTDVSTNFYDIKVGELLWMPGHVGIFIGNGQAVECTPAWKNGVQVTTVRNIRIGTGHQWKKHGKLPYVTYDTSECIRVPDKTINVHAIVTGLPLLKKGSKGDSVKALQILLKGYGYDLGEWGENRDGIDADFGNATENAVECFQEDNDLEADGEVGPITWAALLGV